MAAARCPFCTHTNPVDARFCNECGSPLHLRPCEHCDAVNDVLSRECYRCNAPLRPERALAPNVLGRASIDVDIAPALEASTVISAYGDETAARRLLAPWLDSRLDNARGSLSMDDLRLETTELETADPRREPRLVDGAAEYVEDHNGDAAEARPARYVAALVAILAIAGLAALGSYTFIQRGAPPTEVATPAEPADVAVPPKERPAIEPSDSPSSPDSPAQSASDTTPASAAPPASDAAPASTATSASDAAPVSTASPSSSAAPAAPAPPANSAPRTRTSPLTTPAAAPPERNPASPATSQDAIETQKIITRELGGFAPPAAR